MSTFTFTWPSGPTEVIVTGTFDNWSQSLPLVKQTSGDFELTVPFTVSDDKVLFKFVVDGDWVISKDFKIEKDESGNENNVVYSSDLVSAKSTGSKIPEAGGLAVASTAAVAAATSTATPSATEEVEEKEFKPTVMPSTEGEQVTLGEPGIVIPQNANEIKEFSEISTVDPKTLNEDSIAATTSEEEKTKKVKKVVKKVKKEEAQPAPAATSGSTSASKSPSVNGTPKKEKKKGLFSKIKKALT